MQTNTYQALIISNGLETFAVFIYNCDLLNWIGSVGSYASIGFSVRGQADNFTNFKNSIFSQEPTVGQTACSNVLFNVSYTTIVYRVGVAGTEEQYGRSICMERVIREQNMFYNSQQLIQVVRSQLFLQDCPCTILQASRDTNFKPYCELDTDFDHNNELDSLTCYLGSNFQFILTNGTGFVYRCCYSR